MSGLLDSGASISVLCSGALEFLAKTKLRFKPIKQLIFTADGALQHNLGVAFTEVSNLGKTKIIKLYIIPSLSQRLYLGVDFWREFQLAPTLISELKVKNTLDSNTHELSDHQQMK